MPSPSAGGQLKRKAAKPGQARQAFHSVCRAYSQAPDSVRAWDYDDFNDAVICLGLTPPVDAAFYAVFCQSGKAKASGTQIDLKGPILKTAEERKAALARLKAETEQSNE